MGDELIVFEMVADPDQPGLMHAVSQTVNATHYNLSYVYDNLPLVRQKAKVMIEQKALQLGFEDKVTASLYAATVNPYQVPARQYIKYMAGVWYYLETTLNAMLSGAAPITSVDEVMAGIPTYESYYTETMEELKRFYPDQYPA